MALGGLCPAHEMMPAVNAERLHAIANELREELEEAETRTLLDQLAEGLNNLAESPKQPGPQKQVSEAREKLVAGLSKSRSNEVSPAEEQEIDEMGIGDLLGNSLGGQIEHILSANEITPSSAANGVAEIRDRVQGLWTSLNQMGSAMDFLKIGTEELSPGEFEISFLIPRAQVDNGLERLGNEFKELKKIVAPFSELADEGRAEVQVRAISSSEFQVFIESTPGSTLLFVGALRQILGLYKEIRDIRKSHQDLSGKLPDEILKPMEDYVSDTMEPKIREIAEDVVSKAKLDDQDRLNELTTELTKQLNALIERVDRGFDVNVRAGEIPEEVEGDVEEEEVVDRTTREAAEQIIEAQPGLEFMNVSGKPILHLEAPVADPEGPCLLY